MQVSSVFVAAAAVGALAVGGVALAVSKANSAAAAAPPSVTFTQGRRYSIVVSPGGTPQLPNFSDVQQSLTGAAGGALTLVSLTMSATAITYVVDSLRTVTIPTSGLQVGYAGAIVQVTDLGPSPNAVGTALPPALPPVATPPTGTTAPPATSTSPPTTTAPAPATSSPPTTTPAPVSASAATATTPVTDPGMVTFAQGALNIAITLGVLPNATATAVTGNATDAAFVSNLQQYQTFAGVPSSGTLDFLTWSDLLLSVLLRAQPAQRPPNPTTTDPAIVTVAQSALVACVDRGVFSRLSYGAGNVNGQASDATWVAALAEARRQTVAIGFTVVGSGDLDYASLAYLVAGAWGPLTGASATAVEPATPVTDANDVAVAAASLMLLQQNGILPAASPAIAPASGDPTDPGTVAATRAIQASYAPLAERTGSSGVLDYVTFAYIVVRALPFLFPGATVPLNQTPGEGGTLFQVTSAPDIAGAQMAMALMVQPGFAGSVPAIVSQRWSSSDVGAPATDPNWMTVLSAWAATYGTGQAFSLRTDGALDYPLFAAILVAAYLG